MNNVTFGSAHPRLTLWVGALWAGVNLLIVVSIVLFAAFFLLNDPPKPGEPFLTPPQGQYWVLWAAALMLLAAVVLSLPNPRGYEGDVDPSRIPLVLRWPLKVGNWIGFVAMFVSNIFLIFSTPAGGSALPGNARFAMSITSLVGALAATIMSFDLPGAKVLLLVWAASFVLLFLRGLLGLVRLLPASWLKPAWKEAV